MLIRSITTNDLGACARLLVDSYKETPWRYEWSADKAMKYLTEYAMVKEFVGFVLLEDEEILGALFAHAKTWWTNDQLYIDELFISPGRQRKGYGNKLLEHAERYAKAHQLDSVALMTNKFMPAAGFYKKSHYFQAPQFVFLFKQL